MKMPQRTATCMFVLSESVDSRHDDVQGEAWLHGRFTYVLYRGDAIA